MPGVLLLGLRKGCELAVADVQLLGELRVDGADFGVGDAVAFALGVEDWVDV